MLGLARSVGRFDPFGDIADAAARLERDIRLGLSNAETDMRLGMQEWERRNRDLIQGVAAGTACIVGTGYAGALGTQLFCMPLMGGAAGGAGVLVNPDDAADPNYNAYVQYEQEQGFNLASHGTLALLAIVAVVLAVAL